MRERGPDFVLIPGVATNVCCESTGRDAMMLNFETVMFSACLATERLEMHAHTTLA